MSRPSNASLVMVYKILYDYEKNNKTTQSLQNLVDFSSSVFNYIDKNPEENYWTIDTREAKPYILRICDINKDQCVLNIDKYNKNGKYFVDQFLSCMTYDLLEGCLATININRIVDDFRETFAKMSPTERTQYLIKYGFDFGHNDEETNENLIN